jgi:polar amino acid transport system ATP-binding protein
MRLELDGVVKRFGAQAALDGVTLTVEGPRCVAFIGPSGGGKSTLLRVVAGLETVDAGRVVVNGEAVPRGAEALRRYRASLGVVFQAFNLFPHLTARENLLLPLRAVHGVAEDEAQARAESVLDRFGLSAHADRRPGQLSGGQRQRVAVARAVVVQPRVLLFDEPTSALDPEMTAEVLQVIRELKNEGRDLLLVTHEMGFARHVADEVVFLAGGRVVEHGPAARVFDAPATDVVRQFLARVLNP